jgi:hypothetical protein
MGRDRIPAGFHSNFENAERPGADQAAKKGKW